jgi:LmbE family N-acetylglucosaminyl deacetylase
MLTSAAPLRLQPAEDRPAGRHAAARKTAPAISLDELTRGGPILVLAPHPDDDVLGCGGVIAACAAAGVRTHVAYLTDGGRSHLGAPDWPTARLSAARRREAQVAAQVLGLSHDALTFLPNPDGGLLFDAAARRLTRKALAALVGEHRITRVFATWIGDPHPDHIAAALLARALCRR